MPVTNTEYFTHVGQPGNATTMAAPGHLIGGTSINVDSTSLMSTDTSIFIAIDTTTMINGEEKRVAGSYTVWQAIVTSATSIGSMVLRYGTDQNYSAGASTRVYILPTSSRENRLVDGLLEEHKQTGAHSDINADSVTSTNATLTNATITNLTVGSQTPSPDWTAIATAPDTVTYNGQRSYNLVFNGVDYTNILSPGQRLKTTRTVAAPTQCTSLNGTTQYWNKTSPNKLTFTDDFVVDAYVKLTSYGALSAIVSRYNGTSGFTFRANASGQIDLIGYNAAAVNNSYITSYQSIPLNKWVRVTAQLDMSTFTATTTTSYIMIDGINVPAFVTRGGTNPTALIQAGNLEIGSTNGGTAPFPGKIAQVAIYSAKVTQANIILTHSQGLTGTETSLASAYSFNGVATDLNTTTPNDLTAQNSAGYSADSPFGTQGSGLISSTLDYGIVQSAVFSTNTTVVVQVPEGCAIPTSGGVSAVSYSGLANPYGFKDPGNILGYVLVQAAQASITSVTDMLGATTTVYVPTGMPIEITASIPMTNATVDAYSLAQIKEGATQLQQVAVNSRSGGTAVILTLNTGPIWVSAGSHTYKLTVQGSGGTSATAPGVTNPAYISVKLA